ncbi:hypothetical protein CQZ99_06410 [Pseudomonas poae]|uniref:Uncharacterized protein n=1 Tax=Pseudomonas poae TaxID=200451 RepID=A0A2S9EWR2_9PSED|nr:hypothetical protein CQZ97_19295 [Pseudomonas poae]PRC20973.1 hypothetical protein CQZ99_06410 [Pseudomonas poae]
MSALPSQQAATAPTPALRQQTILQVLGSGGPSIQEVASQLLARELKSLYPNADIPPDTTLVVTPIWEFGDDDSFLPRRGKPCPPVRRGTITCADSAIRYCRPNF